MQIPNKTYDILKMFVFRQHLKLHNNLPTFIVLPNNILELISSLVSCVFGHLLTLIKD